MSVYNTIELTETECIELIAKHMGVYNDYERPDNNEKREMLAAILFKLTDDNHFTEYRFNNYQVNKDV